MLKGKKILKLIILSLTLSAAGAAWAAPQGFSGTAPAQPTKFLPSS